MQKFISLSKTYLLEANNGGSNVFSLLGSLQESLPYVCVRA